MTEAHGHVFMALEHITDLYFYLDGGIIQGERAKKLRETLNEFHTYIENNQRWISKLQRAISRGRNNLFGLSRIDMDQVVQKGMMKKQQMRSIWLGAHRLFQVPEES